MKFLKAGGMVANFTDNGADLDIVVFAAANGAVLEPLLNSF